MTVLAPHFFGLRLSFYALLLGVQFHFTNVLVKRKGWEFVVPEGGYLEVSQSVFQILALVGLITISMLAKSDRPFFVLLSALMAAAVVREFNNHPFYTSFLPGNLKAVLALLLIGSFVALKRKILLAQVRFEIGRPSFVLFLIGFALVVLWAQTLAQIPLLLDPKPDRAVEESLELGGYMLIFCGVLEELISLRQRIR